MDDAQILTHINELVDEEKRLRTAHAGQGLTGDDRARLGQLEEQLDQAWDLLRQRRARAEFSEDPETAQQRPVNAVESYLQ